MSGTIISGTFPEGVSLTNATTTIASGASISNTNSAAVYGAAATDWDLTNLGSVLAGGTGTLSIGVALAGSGTVTNLATIAGYQDGVSLGASGVVVNSDEITGTATGSVGGVGVRLQAGGTLANGDGAAISANFVGAYFGAPGAADNAGIIVATGGAGSYALAMVGSGAVYNQATGTIDDNNVGVVLTGQGVVTNLGSIGSVQNNSAGTLQGYAAIDLRVGGTVTNGASATISSQWIGVQFGQQGTSDGGTITNAGTIFAGNSAGSAGAAVWMHGPGVVLNEAGGTIEGGPYGVVAVLRHHHRQQRLDVRRRLRGVPVEYRRLQPRGSGTGRQLHRPGRGRQHRRVGRCRYARAARRQRRRRNRRLRHPVCRLRRGAGGCRR